MQKLTLTQDKTMSVETFSSVYVGVDDKVKFTSLCETPGQLPALSPLTLDGEKAQVKFQSCQCNRCKINSNLHGQRSNRRDQRSLRVNLWLTAIMCEQQELFPLTAAT